jgi:hypothetical protein
VPKRRSCYRKEFKSLYHKDLALFCPPSDKFPITNFCAILADSAGTTKGQTKFSFRFNSSALTFGKHRADYEKIGFDWV